VASVSWCALTLSALSLPRQANNPARCYPNHRTLQDGLDLRPAAMPAASFALSLSHKLQSLRHPHPTQHTAVHKAVPGDHIRINPCAIVARVHLASLLQTPHPLSSKLASSVNQPPTYQPQPNAQTYPLGQSANRPQQAPALAQRGCCTAGRFKGPNAPQATFEKYSREPTGSAFMEADPGFQLAGHTSPCSSVNCGGGGWWTVVGVGQG